MNPFLQSSPGNVMAVNMEAADELSCTCVYEDSSNIVIFFLCALRVFAEVSAPFLSQRESAGINLGNLISGPVFSALNISISLGWLTG